VPSYTLTSLQKKKEFDGKYGKSIVYRVGLEGPDGPTTAEMVLKAATRPPAEGDRLEGTLEETDFGLKFKRAQAGGFGGGGPRQEDPKKSAAIGRMHAQGMALEYAAIRERQGKLPDEFSLKDLWKIADAFVADAEAARDRA
jgi:hypothetical protein